MARKPYQRDLNITSITFVEDDEEAMERFCEVVKAILYKDSHEKSNNH